MMSDIPHADLIRAVLDGKVVQHSSNGVTDWTDLETGRAVRLLVTQPGYYYRRKPELVEKWATLWKSSTVNIIGAGAREDACRQAELHAGKVLRLMVDPDTLEVIEARTETP